MDKRSDLWMSKATQMKNCLNLYSAASVLGDHEKIQVNISRDNLLEADTQHSWIVKSLKYHQDIVIGNQ